jgi:AcrR family transcriptional regulator
MNGRFFDLRKEKQDRMINAALKAFACEGYRHASTDDMVKDAAISKGLLFHYFGSKLGVYSFVYNYSVRYMKLELSSEVEANETDIFELIKQTERAKMHAMRAYPYMQRFLDKSHDENVSEALLEVEENKNELDDTYEKIWAQADYSSFPSGVDGEKLKAMIQYAIKGLMSDELAREAFQPEMFYGEITEYIDMIKMLVENNSFREREQP